MFLHLIVFGWAIFTAVFSFQLVQIFLYGQEKIALVDIRNIPVLLVLLGVPLIPITIHSFKKRPIGRGSVCSAFTASLF